MYELSDDEKRKIREEEMAALEKKRYRAFVREQLQNPIREEPPAAAPAIGSLQPKVEYFIPWGRVIGFTVVVCLLIVLIAQYSMRLSYARGDGAAVNPFRRSVTEVTPIVTRRVVEVNPRVAVWWKFRIEPRMQQARVFGDFEAAGGWGDDVKVVVADEVEFMNWNNGHGGELAWYSMGKKTSGRFDVPLSPGNYVVAISNKHSLISSKSVSIEAQLKYQHSAR